MGGCGVEGHKRHGEGCVERDKRHGEGRGVRERDKEVINYSLTDHLISCYNGISRRLLITQNLNAALKT